MLARYGYSHMAGIGAFVLAVLLVAVPVVAQDGATQPPDSVIQASLQAASDQLGVVVDDVIVTTAVQRDWPDSSLGCRQPGRAYSQIVTPGYLVTVDTTDAIAEVEVHSNRDGSVTVICSFTG